MKKFLPVWIPVAQQERRLPKSLDSQEDGEQEVKPFNPKLEIVFVMMVSDPVMKPLAASTTRRHSWLKSPLLVLFTKLAVVLWFSSGFLEPLCCLANQPAFPPVLSRTIVMKDASSME